jgi:nucleosome binding factor SPN SPT16 subunit
LLEYPLPILVQSGNDFALNKFNVECDDNKLGSDVVYINVCSKYTDMQAMASRTLLFNPTKLQKEAYELAFDAEQHLMDKLVPGTTLDNVYRSTLEFIKAKSPVLASKVHVNFGFGIGSKYKEEELSISASNTNTKVEPGMVFHIRITFKDVEKPSSKGPIAIGDTVLVEKDGTTSNLTGNIPRKYQ